MREGAGGRGRRRGPTPSPLASPTPPRLPRTETALPSSTRGKGAPPEGEAPERCLPALSPTSLPGAGRRGAPLSHRHRRLRNGRAPRASHSSPQPGATRPPHWLQVTCRGGLRQSAPPERASRSVWKLFRYFQRPLAPARPAPPLPAPALGSRGATTRPRVRAQRSSRSALAQVSQTKRFRRRPMSRGGHGIDQRLPPRWCFTGVFSLETF